jgi:molybdopterin biosynthesis enzyme
MRVAAEDVKAPGPVPRVPYSLRRGYAVRAVDTIGATNSHPIHLQKESRGRYRETQGDPAANPLRPGECQDVDAGIPLPENADAVRYTPPEVTDEVTVPIVEKLKVTAPVRKGDNARLPGEDYARGATLVTRGTRITPEIHAALIAAGVFTVPVYRRPRVGVVLSSYDAVPPANVEHASQRPDSMSGYVRSLLARWGYATPSVEGLAPLRPMDSSDTTRKTQEATQAQEAGEQQAGREAHEAHEAQEAQEAQDAYREQLLDLMSRYDLLIGVGMPAEAAMLANGLGGPVSCFAHGQEHIHFDNTKDRGFICGLGDDRTAPVISKRRDPVYRSESSTDIARYDSLFSYDRAIVLNVPGHAPEVAMVMQLFVPRLLDSMEGVSQPGPVWHKGTLASPLTRHALEHRFLWGVARTDENGRVVIQVDDDQNSLSLNAFATSNALVTIRNGEGQLDAGECVDYLSLE